MKHRASTNDQRVRNPYTIPANWLPGGDCCFWETYLHSEKSKKILETRHWSRFDTRHVKENLIRGNYSDRF